MKFSIVTPAFNSALFIRQTIESVVRQSGDFSIEYIVLDNLSTDGTADIVREYQALLASGVLAPACRRITFDLYCESDAGMYDAIDKGFARATGDVFAWLNSDDVYLPGAFDAVQRSLERYPEISWIKGITSYMNTNSTIYAAGECHLYRQDFIEAGLYGPVLDFIQQDSVFWKAELWRASGGVDPALAAAGDYLLWRSFAKHAPLYSLNAYVSCFRKTPGQKSADLRGYWAEAFATAPVDAGLSSKIWRYLRRIEAIPGRLKSLAFRFVFGRECFYLLTLRDGINPELIADDDYFAMLGHT